MEKLGEVMSRIDKRKRNFLPEMFPQKLSAGNMVLRFQTFNFQLSIAFQCHYRGIFLFFTAPLSPKKYLLEATEMSIFCEEFGIFMLGEINPNPFSGHRDILRDEGSFLLL